MSERTAPHAARDAVPRPPARVQRAPREASPRDSRAARCERDDAARVERERRGEPLRRKEPRRRRARGGKSARGPRGRARLAADPGEHRDDRADVRGVARAAALSRAVRVHVRGQPAQARGARLLVRSTRSFDRSMDRPIDLSIDTRSPLPVAVAPLRPSRSSSISSRPSQAQRVRARARRLGRVLRVLVRRPRGPRSSGRVQARSVSITPVPVRPRRRGACDSLRTFSPGVRLSPPTPSLLSIPTHLDAFQLHP